MRLDLSFLTFDPAFAETFTIVRRASAVNAYGENDLTETQVPDVIGSIQSGNAETLARVPEGARLNDLITVYTKTSLSAEPPGGYADVVIWRGRRFQVKVVTDWVNWGAGWFRADCELIPVNNPAPVVP